MPKSVSAPTSIQLKYSLAELPSSQHRAGLVGLILHVEELKKVSKGAMGVLSLTEESVSIELDEQAVKDLFNALYEATQELQPVEKPYKNVEPVRVEEHQEVDPKSNKIKNKKLYFYHKVVPKGGFLYRRDTSQNKVHVKLWRDMIWQIMRGIPAERGPFEERAAGKQPSDGSKAWGQLSLDAEKSTGLPSTYFIGAQDSNAEGVSFQDKVKYQFLLHFWTYIAQIYVPQLVDRDGRHNYDGFCIAVPDISSLKSFCEDFDLVLQQRSNDLAGFRPRESIVSLPGEAGLDVLRMLNVVQRSSGQSHTGDLVVGVDVLHVRKDGNNVRLLYSGRVEPLFKRDSGYTAISKNVRDFWFRRQRIINLLKGLDWFHGFDTLLTELPLEQGLLSKSFAQDARTSFRVADEQHKEELSMQSTSEKICLEALVLKIVDSYLKRKLADKYELEWSKLSSKEEKRNYSDKKESLATECFYAVRSRNSSEDFINYFASTICSVPQWMSSKEYLSITQELYENTDKIRTLTMLALSARIERGEDKDERKENKENG